MRQLMRLWYHSLLLITPFVFTAINDELFEFNKMMFVYAITVGVAVTWAVWSIRAKKILWRNHALLPVAGLFLASQVLATVFSIHIPTSIFGYYSRFHGGLLSTLAYLVLFQAAVSTLEKADVRPLVRTSLWATLGVSLYAIPEHFGLSPSCLFITGQADTACWIQDVQNRVFATFGQPNWLAAYLIVMIPVGLWYWFTTRLAETRDWTMRLLGWWPLGVIALAATTLAFTKSRSGELGLATAVGVFGLVVGMELLRRRRKPAAFPLDRPHLVGALGALILPFLFFGFVVWGGLESKLFGTATRSALIAETPPVATGTQLESGGTDSGKIRLIVWKGALRVWQRAPLFGSGVETFAYSYYQDRLREHNDISEWDFLYNKAHNEFLNYLATTGLVGLTAYLALLGHFLVLILMYLWQKRKDSEHTFAAAGLLGASAGLAVSNFFGFSTVMIGVLFFLMPAWWLLLTLPEDSRVVPERIPDWERLSTLQWILIAVATCLGLWGALSIAQAWNNDRLLALSKNALAANHGEVAYTTALQLTSNAPNETLFWEQRSLVMARLAMSIGAQDATTAAQLANDADASSQTMLQLNPRHVNLWKSRVRVLLFLATFDDSFLADARDTLLQARQLAPTDAKLPYNLALVAETMGNYDEALQWYQTTLELRPGYTEARESWQQLEDMLAAEATKSASSR